MSEQFGDTVQALSTGRQVLEDAARGVAAAAARFDSAGKAVELVQRATGRLVVTGLGKSGLVGAKLAATFASTGTPSIFVHAADALHGDAGMVVEGDVLLALSKSGETAEVVQFSRMVSARGVPVIAMTGCGGGSTLCSIAAAHLDCLIDREADPYDLVPSTSTTVFVAVGDALAIALMTTRGFGPQDFLVHHPGGSLGSRLREEST
jgi:arabinose-5-phosphate isomerase